MGPPLGRIVTARRYGAAVMRPSSCLCQLVGDSASAPHVVQFQPQNHRPSAQVRLERLLDESAALARVLNAFEEPDLDEVVHRRIALTEKLFRDVEHRGHLFVGTSCELSLQVADQVPRLHVVEWLGIVPVGREARRCIG
jgi:hypothetical protein